MNFGNIAEFILGSIPGIAAVGYFLHRIEKRFNILMVEHEMLMSHYAKQVGINIHDLPTRSKGIQ